MEPSRFWKPLEASNLHVEKVHERQEVHTQADLLDAVAKRSILLQMWIDAGEAAVALRKRFLAGGRRHTVRFDHPIVAPETVDALAE